MQNYYMTADALYDAAMELIAPLPCQEQYIRGLASIFSYHIKKNMLMDAGFDAQELPQQSAIVVAPSGQGKTYILQAISRICNINVITIDGSMLCREGWKGVTLSQQLLAAKNTVRNDDVFVRSIILIDECDKLRHWNTSHDQSNAQTNLLQLFGGESLVAEGEGREPVTIPLNRFTVVLAGAFAGLEDIIRQRVMPQSAIGFARVEKKELNTAELLQMAQQIDLVEYGMMRELIGRIGSLLFIEPMQYEDYHQLLTSENGYIHKYNTFFSSFFGVEITITEGAVKCICGECMSSSTGARAVFPLIDGLMRKAMTIVERDKTISKVIVDALDGQNCVFYEKGQRKSCTLFDEEIPKEEMEPYIIKGTVNEIVVQLCEMYDETEGSLTSLPVLRAFLSTSLLYMTTEVNDEDKTLGALMKMARITKEEPSGYKTTYEILIEEVLKNGTCSSRLAENYAAYKMKQDHNTTSKLMSSLTRIQKHVYKKYHTNSVIFMVTEKETYNHRK